MRPELLVARARCGRRPRRARPRRTRGRCGGSSSAGTRVNASTRLGRELRAQRRGSRRRRRPGRPDRPEVDEALGEEHVEHREEEGGVGAGQDRHPLVGRVGGAASGADRRRRPCRRGPGSRRSRRARRGRPAASRRRPAGCRPCTQVVGALDVGRRDHPHVAVHQERTRRSSATGRRCRPSRCTGSPGPMSSAM